jgi:hypothetical protein
MHDPLIYTLCFGADAYFENLSLMLESLDYIGRYDGNVTVITDRPRDELDRYIHFSLRHRVHVATIAPIESAHRFLAGDFMKDATGPILYMDTDIVVAGPVQPILDFIAAGTEVHVCSEAAFYPRLVQGPVGEITEQIPVGEWFGLSIARSRPDLAARRLPCVNSGLFGFPNRDLLATIGQKSWDLYHARGPRGGGPLIREQSSFNIVIMEAGYEEKTLTEACHLVEAGEAAGERQATFVHFFRARGKDKGARMARFLDDLKYGKRKEGVLF